MLLLASAICSTVTIGLSIAGFVVLRKEYRTMGTMPAIGLLIAILFIFIMGLWLGFHSGTLFFEYVGPLTIDT